MARKIDSISKAIENIQLYSYQYTLKLVGVPEIDPDKKISDTVDICLKVFSGIRAEISASDIDKAHRVLTRNQNGHRRQASQSLSNLPIICKFMQRIIHDNVLSMRRNSNRLLPTNFGLQSENDMKILTFSHLTPMLQELLYLAKSYKEQGSYKYCWAKATTVAAISYQSIIWSLLCVAIATHPAYPDIAHVVGVVSKFCVIPAQRHLTTISDI